MSDLVRKRKPRHARLRSVAVVAIHPSKYPQLCRDRENPYSSQSDEMRLGEIVDICGSILAQASLQANARTEPRAA